VPDDAQGITRGELAVSDGSSEDVRDLCGSKIAIRQEGRVNVNHSHG
jgi:hypothetical protein